MATVIGKTSERIDALLAKLVTNVALVNGRLQISQRDGTIIDAGSIAGEVGVPLASEVPYSGSTNISARNVEAALDELDVEKSPLVHAHDDRYYTEVEMTSLLVGKANTNHAHDDRYFTESETTTLLSGKSDTGHAHNISDVVNLQTALDGKSNTGHLHDDQYYTETEIDSKLATLLASSDLHEDSKFDLVEMDANGPGDQGPITPRLLPIGYGHFWANPVGSPAVYPEISADDAVTHDGQGYSFKLVHPTDTGQSLDSSIFAVSPGSVVTASVWVCGTGGPRAFLTLISSLTSADPTYFQPAGSTYSVESAGNFKPGAEWTKLAVSMVVPSGHTKARIMLRSYADISNGGAAGSIWWDDSATSMQVIPPSDVITGEIKMWPTSSAPTGYLLCQGGTFSSVDYPALAALLGDTFGTHSGTTYYLPDFRGRGPIGSGSTSPSDGSGYTYAIGQKVGKAKHTLTIPEMPSHSHPPLPGMTSFWQANQANTKIIPIGSDFAANGSAASTGNTGGGLAHDILGPSVGVNFIIKAA